MARRRLFGCTLIATLGGGVAAGPLDPPEAPASTPGPEARRPIRQPDLPLTISARGSSWYVAEPLSFSTVDAAAIFVSERFVTIDLNGFTLTGPGSTVGTASSIGIQGGAAAREVTIRNGTITAFGADGIRLAARGGVAEDLHVFDCDERGINFTADNGRVEGCTVQSCDLAGIEVAQGSSVVDCVSRGNGVGVRVGDHSRVESCVVQSNTGDGILSTAGVLDALVTGCVAGGNSGDGIAIVRGTVSQCQANENGGAGIRVDSGGSVHQSRADGNGGTGITIPGAGGVISECTASDNGGGGIYGNIGVLIVRCAANSNDAAGIRGTDGTTILECLSTSNDGDGFAVDRYCTVMDSTARFNTTPANDGAGVRVNQNSNRIEGNSVFSNNIGIITGNTSSLLVVRNHAAGNAQGEYVVPPASALGPVATGFPGATPPGPWDNFDR